MLEKRSFTLVGHRTSVALEAPFWAALERAAERAGQSLLKLIAHVDAERAAGQSLASALRLHALSQSVTNQPCR